MKEVLLETLWPVRCACCEAYGSLLCDECMLNLGYIDTWKACPVCGSPFGRKQCCDCSTTMLEPLGYERPPYEACVSAVNLDADTGRLVTLYKDAGDRGLADVMALVMDRVTPPAWRASAQALAYIPAGESALRRRGWDHGETLAEAYGRRLCLPVLRLFERPRAVDQRILTRAGRFRNMANAISLKSGATVPASVILVDDVYTTGSTLFAATERIKEVRPDAQVRCITFARA